MAGVSISTKIQKSAIDDIASQLDGVAGGVRRALSSAINDTVTRGKTNIVRRMQEILTLKRASIAEVVNVTKTNAGSNPMVGKITVSDAARPLIDFPHRKLKKGYSVRIRKGRPSKFPRSFIAKMKSGHVGMFGRVKGAGVELKTKQLAWYDATGAKRHTEIPVAGSKKPKIAASGFVARLPIKELYGPGVTAVLTNTPGLVQEELDKLTDYMLERLYSQTDRLLQRTKTRPVTA